VTVGYTPSGKRIVRTASDKHKSKALAKLRAKVRDLEDGLPSEDGRFTVKQTVENWLTYGLNGRDRATVEKCTILANKHIIPELGARKLRELSADDIDQWLMRKTADLSTRTLREVLSILKRAVSRAQARDKVKRNVVLLCEVPTGRAGRPSKSLNFEQAMALLNAAEQAAPWLFAYIVLSLLTGARTEELRELTWSHVVADDQDRKEWVPVTVAGWAHEDFAVYVWRSVRATGDTKTKKSRRSLKLPQRCVWSLDALWESRKDNAGSAPGGNDLVFATRNGIKLDAANVRREFRTVAHRAGLTAKEWTPRELRHSFVSLLSDSGMPVEQISRLVGHSGTTVTEEVYRKQIRPVIQDGAVAMDQIFPSQDLEA
jgi:integrase